MGDNGSTTSPTRHLAPIITGNQVWGCKTALNPGDLVPLLILPAVAVQKPFIDHYGQDSVFVYNGRAFAAYGSGRKGRTTCVGCANVVLSACHSTDVTGRQLFVRLQAVRDVRPFEMLVVLLGKKYTRCPDHRRGKFPNQAGPKFFSKTIFWQNSKYHSNLISSDQPYGWLPELAITSVPFEAWPLVPQNDTSWKFVMPASYHLMGHPMGEIPFRAPKDMTKQTHVPLVASQYREMHPVYESCTPCVRHGRRCIFPQTIQGLEMTCMSCKGTDGCMPMPHLDLCHLMHDRAPDLVNPPDVQACRSPPSRPQSNDRSSSLAVRGFAQWADSPGQFGKTTPRCSFAQPSSSVWTASLDEPSIANDPGLVNSSRSAIGDRVNPSSSHDCAAAVQLSNHHDIDQSQDTFLTFDLDATISAAVAAAKQTLAKLDYKRGSSPALKFGAQAFTYPSPPSTIRSTTGTGDVTPTRPLSSSGGVEQRGLSTPLVSTTASPDRDRLSHDACDQPKAMDDDKPREEGLHARKPDSSFPDCVREPTSTSPPTVIPESEPPTPEWRSRSLIAAKSIWGPKRKRRKFAHTWKDFTSEERLNGELTLGGRYLIGCGSKGLDAHTESASRKEVFRRNDTGGAERAASRPTIETEEPSLSSETSIDKVQGHRVAKVHDNDLRIGTGSSESLMQSAPEVQPPTVNTALPSSDEDSAANGRRSASTVERSPSPPLTEPPPSLVPQIDDKPASDSDWEVVSAEDEEDDLGSKTDINHADNDEYDPGDVEAEGPTVSDSRVISPERCHHTRDSTELLNNCQNEIGLDEEESSDDECKSVQGFGDWLCEIGLKTPRKKKRKREREKKSKTPKVVVPEPKPKCPPKYIIDLTLSDDEE